MSSPIKFDPNEKISSESSQKVRKATEVPGKFKDLMEGDDGRMAISKLKKHNKSLDAETEDLEEFGKVKEDDENVSLFDLSASKSRKQAQRQQTPHDLFGQQQQQNKREDEPLIAEATPKITVKEEQHMTTKTNFVPEEPKEIPESKPIATTKQKISQKEDLAKEKPKFSEEEEKPTFVEKPKEAPVEEKAEALPLPLTQAITSVISQVKVVEKPIPAPIQEIIDQIVDYISQLDYHTKTETVVTLKHPPLFAGAQVVLTTYPTAKKELNISFENLSTKAKTFLDQHTENLRVNLEQKGYITHMITTTTQIENRPYSVEQDAFARGERENQQQQRQQQQFEEEDEE